MKSVPLFGNLCVALTLATVASAQPLTTARDDFPSSLGARGITSADFNRDGWPDFATANEGPNGVSVLLNRGATGGFTASFIPLTGGPFDIAAADLNKDSISDLAVANADGNLINVLLGRPGGGFAAAQNIGAIGNPRGLTIADMNADGNLDIIYTEFNFQGVQILFGNGAGSFPLRSGSATVGLNPQGIVAADFNLDGRTDLGVACNGSGLSLLFQQPPGTFLRQDIAGQRSLNVLAAADVNRDGRIDIAAANTSGNLLAIYVNRSSGIASSVTYSTGASPRGVAAADLNRDGIPDIVTASRASNTTTVFIGSGRSDGAVASQIEIATGTGSRVATVSDFDNDGRFDIATGNEFAGNVTVLSNTTSFIKAGFAFHLKRIGTDSSTGSGAQSSALADFDHDGKTDAVVEHFPRGFDTILGSGRQVPVTAQDLRIGRLEAGLLNGDAHPDIVAVEGNFGTTPSILWTFLGDGTGRSPNTITTDPGLLVPSLTLADLNRDGKTDVLVIGTAVGNAQEWFARSLLGRGDGGFTPMPAVPLKPRATGIAVADVNRDGIPDFGVFYDSCCANGNALVDVFKGDGRGGFTALQSVGFPQWWTVIGADFADVNHDGRVDLVANGYTVIPNFSLTPGIAVAPGSAQGFAEPRFDDRPIEFATGPLRLADMNVDGNIDIITAAGDLLPGNGDLTFGPPQGFLFFGDNHHIADFDRDGLPDIVYGFLDSLVDVLLNQRQATNTPPVVDAGSDQTFTYDLQFDEEPLQFNAIASDADMHRLRTVWRDSAGRLVSTDGELELTNLDPGTYSFTATADDGRGGIASDTLKITILPMPEVVVHVAQDFVFTEGNWEVLGDGSAASGLRLHDRNLGAPKVTRPVATPASFGQIGFVADPTQTYKLWIRLKADANTFSNDSVWLQISGAVDGAGNPIAVPGTTSGIEINLEECSGCGVSGWGWRDEAWGQRGAIGALTLRFPKGGQQLLRFQTREDGVSIDQFVLSAEKYRTTRPGAVKNDATILPPTLVWQRF